MHEKPIRRKMALHKSTKQDVVRARSLRNNMSPVERRFWSFLVDQTKGTELKFRRQHPIHPYFADFVCLSANLVIELDGFSHDSQVEHDRVRDDYLRNKGYEILRFSNEDAVKKADWVIETILKVCAQRV